MNPHIRAAAIDDVSPDAELLAALLTEYRTEPVTVARLLEWQDSAPADRVLHQVITDSGVGFADTFRDPHHPPGDFLARVLVTSPACRQGLGSRLLGEVEGFARTHGARRLCLAVEGECAAGAAFAEKHGYTAYQHLFESTLDPRSLDPDVLAAPVPAGIDVASLAEWGDTEPHRQLVWELHGRADRDEPGNDDDSPSYRDFSKEVFGQEHFRPERLFVALADARPVGAARLDYHPLTHSLYHSGMAVDREFRRRGVASALKRATIHYALRIDAAYLRAHNDSQNGPMLAINRRYGYIPSSGRFWVAREL